MDIGALSFWSDVNAFLKPVAGPGPAGPSLRYDPVYEQIAEARRGDDPTVPLGAWNHELKKADWDRVAALAAETLELRSKDLQVAAWLLEAWMHLYGFAGTRVGLLALHTLCDHFWADLHPQLDADDPEVRNAPFHWINEKLSVTLATLRITAPEAPDALAYSWSDFQEALRYENLLRKKPELRKAPDSAERVSPARFAASVSLTPREFYLILQDQIGAALKAAAVLETLLDQRLGAAAPGLNQFHDTLAAIHRWVETVLREKPAPAPAADPQTPEDAMQVEVHADGGVSRAHTINSRDEAYRMLGEVAEYLLRTEPHSPTPFLLRRAVSWGSKSLSDLLVEFVEDGYDLKTLRVFLGIDHGRPRKG